MARGRRRLGAVLTQDLIAVLAELAGTASPYGGERPLADRFAAWAASRWPSVEWTVRPLDDGSASVLATVGSGPADLVLYSHLDTSLTGDPTVDAAITGRTDHPVPYLHDGDTVSGFGLGVAKAPAAAAVVGFVRAATPGTQLLLAARGTHRTSWSGHARTGVTEYLENFSPRAAVVAKGGPPGVLRHEPAALYLRVRVAGRWGPLMFSPNGGLLAEAADVLAAVSAWGAAYATVDAVREPGASFGLGSLRAGSPEKADLAPAGLELVSYLVLPGPIEPGAAAASLREHLGGRAEVDEEILGNGPGTPADALIVRAATDAYTAEFPVPAPITGWTGSTDGVVFRAAGVPTARLGPRPIGGGDDSRVDTFSLTELEKWARVYERIARVS